MSNLFRRLVLVILAGLLLAGGCVVGFALAQRFAPAPSASGAYFTPTPGEATARALSDHGTEAAATARVITGGLLFEDPFVFSPSEVDSTGYLIKNTDDGLIITNRESGHVISAYSDKELPWDVDVSVTIQGVPPPPCENTYYHLVVRIPADRSDMSGNYRFIVWTHQTWEFNRIDPATGEMQAGLASGGTNGDFDPMGQTTLRVVAKGSHYDLYLNGRKLGSAEDSTATSKNTRIGVGVFTCTAATVRFTNLIVRTPQ